MADRTKSRGLVQEGRYRVLKRALRRFKVQDGGKLGIMLIQDGSFESVIHWAKSEAMFQRLLADYEVPANAHTITI